MKVSKHMKCVAYVRQFLHSYPDTVVACYSTVKLYPCLLKYLSKHPTMFSKRKLSLPTPKPVKKERKTIDLDTEMMVIKNMKEETKLV